MSGPTTHAAGSSTGTVLSQRPLTKSALDAHDLPEGSRLTVPNNSSRSTSAPPIILTPLDHLRNTSYFPVTLKSIVTSNIPPSLTPAQSQAHALGHTAGVSPTSGRFYTFPSPPIPLPQALPIVLEAPGSGSIGKSVSQESLTRQPSTKASTTPPSSLASTLQTSASGGRLVVKAKTRPKFTWTLGSLPQPIFDPDYPDGTPACISPRARSTPATGVSGPGSSSRDYFSTPVSRSSPKVRALMEALDATYPSLHPSNPLQLTSATQPATAAAVQPGDPQPPPASTALGASTGEEPLIVDLMLRKLSEITAVRGSLGTVDDVFGHISSVRSDGTHPKGVIPWAEMPKYVAQAKKEASEKEKKALELDKRLKKELEAREGEVIRPTDNMESKWIKLGPLWTCAVVGVEDHPLEADGEFPPRGSVSATESGDTFTTALSHQEPEEELRPPFPERRTRRGVSLQADASSDVDGFGSGDEVDDGKLIVSGQVK